MKEKNKQISEQLLLCCFSFFSQHLSVSSLEEIISVLQDCSTWNILLFIEQNPNQDKEYVESKQVLLNVIQHFIEILSTQSRFIIHSILQTIEKVAENMNQPSIAICHLIQGLFMKHILSSNSIFLGYNLLLHFLPHQVFITNQPSYDSVVFLHQLSEDPSIPSNHLSLLVNQWNEAYTKVTQIQQTQENEYDSNSFFSNSFWLSFLQHIQNDQDMDSFILLLSEFLTQFGISTVFFFFLFYYSYHDYI